MLHSSAMNRDNIYSNPLAKIADFTFDAHVADVFNDMIERSVPGYRSIITMIEILAGHYAQPGTHLYDLGCSLGASALAMRRGLTVDGCRIFAVDNSEAMVERCSKAVQRDRNPVPIDILCADIRDVKIENASVVVLNFTLQFIPREERPALLEKIARGMLPGGILILSEKVLFDDDHLNRLLTDIHHDFKRAHGYSDLEISQKRTALENVLLPESISVHRKRLIRAGFSSVDVWFQCFNFMSMLAIK